MHFLTVWGWKSKMKFMWNWLTDESSSLLQVSSLNSHGLSSECFQKSLSLPFLIRPAWISLDMDPVFMITFNLNNLLKTLLGACQKALVVKNLPANAGDVRDVDSTPGLGRSPGGGHDNPLQYSCLENPMDRGAWRALVYRVAKSKTQLKRPSMHACKDPITSKYTRY